MTGMWILTHKVLLLVHHLCELKRSPLRIDSRPAYVKQPLKIAAEASLGGVRQNSPEPESICHPDQIFLLPGETWVHIERMHTAQNESSNKAVITEKCQIFHPAADSWAVRCCRGPAHAVKSSHQQQRALWVLSNQRGLPVTAKHFWILTMPTEIWSRIKLGVCGPPPRWGQTAILKHFERSLVAWVEDGVGALRHFGKMSVGHWESCDWISEWTLGEQSMHSLTYNYQNRGPLQPSLNVKQHRPAAKTRKTENKAKRRIAANVKKKKKKKKCQTPVSHRRIHFQTWVKTYKTAVAKTNWPHRPERFPPQRGKWRVARSCRKNANDSDCKHDLKCFLRKW